MPGASVSPTLVELKVRLLGVVPLRESTVSQLGIVAVFTWKNTAFGALRATLTFPGEPEPLTYVSEGTFGENVIGVGGTICSVTAMLFVGTGAVPIVIVPEAVPEVRPLQPAAAWTVKVAGLVVAGLPDTEPTVSHVGGEVTATGVPPLAAEVTEIVWAGPGVQLPPFAEL